MKQAIICIGIVFFMIVWVSCKEAQFEEKLKENNKYYESRLDMVISDAVEMMGSKEVW